MGHGFRLTTQHRRVSRIPKIRGKKLKKGGRGRRSRMTAAY